MPIIHDSYRVLANEAPATATAFAFDGHLFTHADIQEELSAQSDIGAAYATALVVKMLDFIARQDIHSSAPAKTIAASIRIDVTPRLCAIEQYQAMPEHQLAWKTMSASYSTSEMVALLQARDPIGLSFISELLRVCRDLIGRQTKMLVQPA